MPKKVSVIIPTYNRAQLLKRAMDSVYAQTYRPIELLVINNACTDDTDRIVGQFQAKNDATFELIYIKQAKNDRNGARNIAIQKATGELICFLDDDDEFLPSKLEKQAKFIDQNKGVDIVFSNSLLDADGETRPFYPSLASHGLKNHTQEEVIRQLCEGNFIPITNVMIRAKVIKENPFDLKLYSHEDYELWLRLAPRFHFDWIDEPLSLVHSHEHTARYDQGGVRIDQINVLFKYLPDFPEHFFVMMAKLKRLEQLLTEHYKKNNEMTKLSEFERSFVRRSSVAMIRQLQWIEQNEKGINKYIRMFKLKRLSKGSGLLK